MTLEGLWRMTVRVVRPVSQCILMVVQGLCNAWVPWENNSGFQRMTGSDGLDTTRNVCTHAGPEFTSVAVRTINGTHRGL